MRISAWVLRRPGEPMVLEQLEANPGPDEVLVEVAGCGICHTDIAFCDGEAPTRHSLPLVLGHEISGTVVAAGRSAASWIGRPVIIPAVIPCETCDACRQGLGSICPNQIFPGNDVHGGFGTHLTVPARGLCPVPSPAGSTDAGEGPDLASLAVIADAISTPFQAVQRSGLGEGDLAVFVGTGGVGGFGVQIAAALRARVVAIDVDEQRLRLMAERGAELTLDARETPFKQIRRRVREFGSAHGIPSWRQKIFETSGTVAGQATAFGLLGHGGYLGIVGYTPEKVSLCLSNLMALHATVQGNWGCLPRHYPAVLDLVHSGKVVVQPFVEKRPLSTINDAFDRVRSHQATRRIVLQPER
ncbi:MAG: 6-hydroxycyclohex-1-ene-1-carbonyl-CoA dehydrogenase [Acidobacteriota bacterium]